MADGAPKELRMQAIGREISQVRIEDGSPSQIVERLRALDTVELVDWSGTGNIFQVESHKEQSSRRAIFQLCVANNWSSDRNDPN